MKQTDKFILTPVSKAISNAPNNFPAKFMQKYIPGTTICKFKTYMYPTLTIHNIRCTKKAAQRLGRRQCKDFRRSDTSTGGRIQKFSRKLDNQTASAGRIIANILEFRVNSRINDGFMKIA